MIIKYLKKKGISVSIPSQLDVSASPWTWMIVLLDLWSMDNWPHFQIECKMRPITFTDGQIFIFDGGIGRENKFTGKVADLNVFL